MGSKLKNLWNWLHGKALWEVSSKDCMNFSVLFVLACIQSCSPEASECNSTNNELSHCKNLLWVLAFPQLSADQTSALGGRGGNTSQALDSALWSWDTQNIFRLMILGWLFLFLFIPNNGYRKPECLPGFLSMVAMILVWLEMVFCV